MKFETKDLILIFILIIASWIVMFIFGFQLASRKKIPNKLDKQELTECLDELSTCQKDYAICSGTEQTATNTPNNKNSNLSKRDESKETKQKVEKSTEKDLSSLNLKVLSPSMKGKYTVQVGAFQSEYDAQQLTFSLYNAGFKDSYYRAIKVPGKGVWYRVGIGFFAKRSSAEVFANMLLEQKKIKSYIVRKL